MEIGIIGAGAIAQAFARQAIQAGHTVILSNRRGPDSLTEVIGRLGPRARADHVAAAAAAELVVLSVPWQQLAEAVAGLPDWGGRIVIDTTNPVIQPGFRLAELGGKTSSEVVAGLLPGARLVKAFNTLPSALLVADPQEAGGRRVVFLSGDDAGAKAEVGRLIDDLGFTGIDLGSLADGGRLQQFPGGPLPVLNLIRLP